jgi:CRP/FNR family transcriptional regulator, anaerobic regulatory protein
MTRHTSAHENVHRVVAADSTSPFGVLRAYLEARGSFTHEQLQFIRTMFVPRALRAGEFMQRAGAVAQYAAFVAQGCLRTYTIDAEGNEHIVKFAPETWWVTDSASIINRTPSEYFIQALEHSELLLIDMPSHEALVEKVPPYAAAYRTGLQRHVAAKDKRIVSSLSASAQDRYLQFLETYPSLATRVPQRMLASYLGVTPETVSRIRRKLART